MSYAVSNPRIADVLDLRTGTTVTAEEAIGTEYDAAVQLRLTSIVGVLRQAPRFACVQCGSPVRLRGQKLTRLFHFAHIQENLGCPVTTRLKLSRDEINARRYNGAKESDLHLRMKEWICESLSADGRFTDVLSEKRWTNALTGAFRKPDVQAMFQGMRVAFEVQLSSTYIDVIAERREFYRNEGALLFWIFARFEEEERKLTQDDIYYNNNQNAFLVSAETLRASRETGRFHLDAVWREPLTWKTVSSLQRRLVSFEELTFDLKEQQAYFFDFYGAQASLLAGHKVLTDKRNEERRRERQALEKACDANNLRQEFWRARGEWLRGGETAYSRWSSLEYLFGEAGLWFPDSPEELPEKLLDVLRSFELGTPVGPNCYGAGIRSLVDLVDVMLPGENRMQPDPYLPYLWRMIANGERTLEWLKAMDLEGRWERKALAQRRANHNGARPPRPAEERVEELLDFLFPQASRL